MRFVVWRHSQAWTCELKLVTLCLSCSESGMLHGSTNRFGPYELGQNIHPECVCLMCAECECVYVCVMTVFCVECVCLCLCVECVHVCVITETSLSARGVC